MQILWRNIFHLPWACSAWAKGTSSNHSWVCVCGAGFHDKKTLLRHESIHTGIKPFPCEHCDKSFMEASYRKRHVIDMHTAKLSNEGETSFPPPHLRKKHEVEHLGDKPYRCELCNLEYASKMSLRVHMNSNKHLKAIPSGESAPDEKQYKCQYCDERFFLPYQVRDHERYHTGEKPFKCQYCEKSFRIKPSLTCHERVHTGERPYQCRYCGSKFNQSSNLKTHVKNHCQNYRSRSSKVKKKSAKKKEDNGRQSSIEDIHTT